MESHSERVWKMYILNLIALFVWLSKFTRRVLEDTPIYSTILVSGGATLHYELEYASC
jgi:hypothetical protein